MGAVNRISRLKGPPKSLVVKLVVRCCKAKTQKEFSGGVNSNSYRVVLHRLVHSPMRADTEVPFVRPALFMGTTSVMNYCGIYSAGDILTSYRHLSLSPI
jgi:hypothetical protein